MTDPTLPYPPAPDASSDSGTGAAAGPGAGVGSTPPSLDKGGFPPVSPAPATSPPPSYPTTAYPGYPNNGNPNTGYPNTGYADPASANSAAPGAIYSNAAIAPSAPTNVLAIISLVLALFIPIGGIITGHIALSQIKRTGENGRGLALAGTIIGWVYSGLIIVGVVIYILIFVVILGSVAWGSGGFSSY